MTKQHVNQGWIDKLDTHKDKSNDGDIGDDNDVSLCLIVCATNVAVCSCICYRGSPHSRTCLCLSTFGNCNCRWLMTIVGAVHNIRRQRAEEAELNLS
eukprot:gene10078-2245_t